MDMKRKINKLFLLFVLVIFTSCRTVRTVGYDIEEERVSDEIRIVQISDFHSNDFGKNESTIIEKIKKARPDIIAITGDLFDERMGGDKPFKNVEALLAGIRDLCPGFFVTGNHDFSDLHIDKKYAMLEHYGFKVLHDEAITLDFPQGTVVISGVEDPYLDLGDRAALKVGDNRAAYRARLAAVAQKTDTLVRSFAVEGEKAVLFTLLLAHRPEYVNDYVQYDFDVILAGHAHGGQWRFPPFINALYAPGQGMFPKYAGGKYVLKNASRSVMIVSRGLSYQQPKVVRIFNNPELTLVRVIPVKSVGVP